MITDKKFTWGDIVVWHRISDFQILEYMTRDTLETMYHCYENERCISYSTDNLDDAILLCLGYRYDGANSRFADHAHRMLDISGKYK